VTSVTPVADAAPLGPGVLAVAKNEVLVGTGTVPVRLGEVKAFGKKQMPAADWARGVRLATGVEFR
jgi:methionyl-tRNA formyltransferase